MYTAETQKFYAGSGNSTPLPVNDAFRMPLQPGSSDELLKPALLDEFANPANILHGSTQVSSVDTPKEVGEMSNFFYPNLYSNAMSMPSYPLFADAYPAGIGDSAQQHDSQQYSYNLPSNMVAPYQLFTDGGYPGYEGFHNGVQQHGYSQEDSFLYGQPGGQFPSASMSMAAHEKSKPPRAYNRRRHSVSHSGDLESADPDAESTSKHLNSEKKRRAAINELYSILEEKVEMLIEGKSSKAKILHASATLMSHYKQILTQHNVPF